MASFRSLSRYNMTAAACVAMHYCMNGRHDAHFDGPAPQNRAHGGRRELLLSATVTVFDSAVDIEHNRIVLKWASSSPI
jgi:hypothetical protein